MAKQKRRSISKVSEEPYSAIDAAVLAANQVLRARKAALYDGVLGTLPDWVPGNIHQDFELTRNRLLDSEFSATQVRAFVQAYVEDQRAAIADPWNALSRFPFVLPPKVRADVHQLSHIWVGCQLSPTEGLAFFTDKRYATKVAKGEKHSKQQSLNASKPRGSKSDVHRIIRVLAMREEDGAKELWNRFYGDLDSNHLHPEVDEPPGDHTKWTMTYDYKYSSKSRRPKLGRKMMRLGQFANLISRYRSEVRKKSG